MARHATVLTLLVSFAACSHGSEPRPRLADDARQPAPVGGEAPGARAETSNQAKHGVIRSAQAVPAPDALDVQPGVASKVSRSVATPALALAAEPLESLPHPRMGDEESSARPVKPVAPQLLRASVTVPNKQPDTVPATNWLLVAVLGAAGAAGVSLLVLALLGRRDRRAAEKQREADDRRTQELVRTEMQRVREEERLGAQERAAEDERARALAAAAAAALAATQAAEQRQHQGQADLSTVHERAQKKVDPRIVAAHNLFDLLHRAERDVEPFLRLLDAAVPNDVSSADARSIVTSWHESILSTRNRLSEALTRHQAPVDLQPVEPAADLQAALSRLIDHAARMNALMVSQQQQDSAILHWSRQLPGALVQLFWRAQTAKYSSTMTQLPKVPDTPAPTAVEASSAAATARVAAPRPLRTHDKAIQQALRGAQRHAAST